MLMCSLVMFTLGILCQVYSMFSPNEPYMQQMSFMFVAMPSVLAIINHYYQENVSTSYQKLPQPSEEKTTSSAIHTNKRVLSTPNIDPSHVVADTSQDSTDYSGYLQALSEHTDDDLLDE